MNNFRNFKKIFKFFFSKIDNYSFSGIKLKQQNLFAKINKKLSLIISEISFF